MQGSAGAKFTTPLWRRPGKVWFISRIVQEEDTKHCLGHCDHYHVVDILLQNVHNECFLETFGRNSL